VRENLIADTDALADLLCQAYAHEGKIRDRNALAFDAALVIVIAAGTVERKRKRLAE
jgi:hypothetical protein